MIKLKLEDILNKYMLNARILAVAFKNKDDENYVMKENVTIILSTGFELRAKEIQILPINTEAAEA